MKDGEADDGFFSIRVHGSFSLWLTVGIHTGCRSSLWQGGWMILTATTDDHRRPKTSKANRPFFKAQGPTHCQRRFHMIRCF